MNDATSFLSVSSHLLSKLQSFKISVLLIDDQMIIAEAVKRMLSDQPDIVFHYCSDPSKALTMAAQVNPTVILQDLVMPEFDGLLLVKYFRANPATRDIPVIVLSTKEDPQTKAEAFALGAHDYIVKLPDRLELVARIRYHSNGYIRLLERNEAFKRLEESQRILQGELADAAAYVKSLLPPPLHQGIQTDWRFIPSTQLGGDTIGYHWLDDRYFAMYLLDVCGHGVGAALHSVSIMNILRSQTLPRADFYDPSSVLTVLNQTFQMEEHNNMFFTMWYGIYDKVKKQILYSNGGHPPAILITGESKDKAKIYELKNPGIAIGAISAFDFQNATCQVESYNRLYIFSDGVYEIPKKDGEMMQIPEFTDLLVQTHQKQGSELDDIVQRLQNLQGAELFVDDFSLLQVIFEK